MVSEDSQHLECFDELGEVLSIRRSRPACADQPSVCEESFLLIVRTGWIFTAHRLTLKAG